MESSRSQEGSYNHQYMYYVHIMFACVHSVLCGFFSNQISLPLSVQLSRSMLRHHQEQSTMAQRSEKEELQRMRKVASSIAKEVKHFWESVRKVYTTSKMCVCVCVC